MIEADREICDAAVFFRQDVSGIVDALQQF